MTYYDTIASGYSELHREEQLKKIALIKKHIPFHEKWKILDVGCGPYFADFPGTVVGIDPSFQLLKLAKQKILAALGKGEMLPFRTNAFMVVVSITALQNFDDIEQGLLEMKRVAKEFIVISALKKSPKIGLIEELMGKIFPSFKAIEEEKDIIFFCRKY
ncbi:class I SAM-dependent methyltransferase [Candidatus Woesearchaeota archaeon]|nr:class I SAM-dependent methyltransferase [Candidatus Woesearchaeota archaeon]